MKYKAATIALLAPVILLGASNLNAQPKLGPAIIPIMDLYNKTCYLPRKEIRLGEEEEFEGWETIHIGNCPATADPRWQEGTYTAYLKIFRNRTLEAGTGPNANFNSGDYPEVPCVIIAGTGQMFISYDWSVGVKPVDGLRSRLKMTCNVGEEVEVEDLTPGEARLMGIAVE